jgi:hypothetical protein
MAELRRAMMQIEADLTRFDNEDRANARQRTVELAKIGSRIA